MKNAKLKNRERFSRAGRFFLIFNFAFLISIARADDFGDVSIDANAIYTGNTFHGYAEMRVNVQNRSHGKSHVVTLVYPNNSYGSYGNNISRLSRTVTVAPQSLQVVS